MTGKEFSAHCKKLHAKVKRVNSSYWGETWYEAVFYIPVGSIEIIFREGKPITDYRVLGKSDFFIPLEDLKKSAEIYEAVAALVAKINQ